MSLLSSFIMNQLIKSLEEQFIAHLPNMQEVFIKEISILANQVVNWINDKIKTHQLNVEEISHEKRNEKRN
jgi:hypothetical protein